MEEITCFVKAKLEISWKDFVNLFLGGNKFLIQFSIQNNLDLNLKETKGLNDDQIQQIISQLKKMLQDLKREPFLFKLIEVLLFSHL